MFPKEDIGKYARNKFGIRILRNDTFYFNDMDKMDFDLTKVLEPGDIILVDDVPYTLFQDDNILNGKLYIVRITKDLMPRFTAVSYLFECNQIQSVLTKERFRRECFNLPIDIHNKL